MLFYLESLYLSANDTIPDGYIKGTDIKPDVVGSKNPSFGKHWFTNNIINIHDTCDLSDCPDGFRVGMVRGLKSMKLKNYLESVEEN